MRTIGLVLILGGLALLALAVLLATCGTLP